MMVRSTAMWRLSESLIARRPLANSNHAKNPVGGCRADCNQPLLLTGFLSSSSIARRALDARTPLYISILASPCPDAGLSQSRYGNSDLRGVRSSSIQIVLLP